MLASESGFSTPPSKVFSKMILWGIKYCARPFDQTREQHNKKRSVLILFGKRLGLRELKGALLVAPKWIFINLRNEFALRISLVEISTENIYWF
jgi:hypothetical protein